MDPSGIEIRYPFDYLQRATSHKLRWKLHRSCKYHTHVRRRYNSDIVFFPIPIYIIEWKTVCVVRYVRFPNATGTATSLPTFRLDTGPGTDCARRVSTMWRVRSRAYPIRTSEYVSPTDIRRARALRSMITDGVLRQ